MCQKYNCNYVTYTTRLYIVKLIAQTILWFTALACFTLPVVLALQHHLQIPMVKMCESRLDDNRYCHSV